MSLKLMYITNQPSIAKIAEENDVDRIFVDLEYIGKEERQPGDTVKSKHTIDDVRIIKNVLKKSDLIVRVNPIHSHSQDEIDKVINNGADIVMLPYFKTVEEVRKFINFVDGRVKTSLLVETPEAVEIIDSILDLDGIDEVHIGLNDLHLGYHMSFMFELLCNGVVENLCQKFKERNLIYGFGGFGRIGFGDLPAEKIIIEHYRLESSVAILSRSFCNLKEIKDENKIKNIFETQMKKIRSFEKNVSLLNYDDNFKEINQIVSEIVRIRK